MIGYLSWQQNGNNMHKIFVFYFLGYYARWAVLRKLLHQFLSPTNQGLGKHCQPRKQILSLGAGYDTTYFQLKVYISEHVTAIQ